MPNKSSRAREESAASGKPKAAPAAKRRIPQQERGHKTIEVILQAAGQEIARGGLAKLTTRRIAEAAGLSVGGLYEYFPNKEAVVHALASQWLERIKDAIAAIHPDKTGCVDLIRYLGMVYDAVRPHYQQVPGVSVLISLLASVPALQALEDEIDLQVNALLTDAIAHLLPYVGRDQCSIMARTMTILDHYLLIEAIMRDPAHAALFDTHHRICQHALASHLILLNEQARTAANGGAPKSFPQPASWPAPRPEAPPDVT
ncbi:MAG: TetR/AcrR family transcriptional regulator [Pseudomonadota bacterium]